jgi:hypothetical protein
MYDVIGDVHGQGGKLKALLAKMGYLERAGAWRAPDGRKAVFVGDLIDRGPDQLEVLNIVRRMVDAGQAMVVMGNHEFNAIGMSVRDDSGRFLRPRNERKLRQHAAFLDAVGIDSNLHREWVDWFRTLPMALDLGGLRVVHAWWDESSRECVNRARGGECGVLGDELMVALYRDPELKAARKLLTCGAEWDLPPGVVILDKEGHAHGEARLAVWRHWAERLPEIALVPSGGEDRVPDIEIPRELRLAPIEGSPILFGHHWFSGVPALETPKIACVDWSAAGGGPLVAYRWDGEAELQHDKLVAAGADGV